MKQTPGHGESNIVECILAEKELLWYQRAARKMVREGKNFFLATDEMGINGITPLEGKKIFESDTFQTLLRQERLKLANEYANDPQISKNTAIGMMLMAIEKLFAEAEWDKALEGIQKLSKLTGWQGSEGNINVFQGLSARDFDELRRKVEARASRKPAPETLN